MGAGTGERGSIDKEFPVIYKESMNIVLRQELINLGGRERGSVEKEFPVVYKESMNTILRQELMGTYGNSWKEEGKERGLRGGEKKSFQSSSPVIK